MTNLFEHAYPKFDMNVCYRQYLGALRSGDSIMAGVYAAAIRRYTEV